MYLISTLTTDNTLFIISPLHLCITIEVLCQRRVQYSPGEESSNHSILSFQRCLRGLDLPKQEEVPAEPAAVVRARMIPFPAAVLNASPATIIGQFNFPLPPTTEEATHPAFPTVDKQPAELPTIQVPKVWRCKSVDAETTESCAA